MPDEVITVHQPDKFELYFYLEGKECPPFDLDPELPTYGDGSALRPAQITVARAGFAIAQFKEDGTIYKLIMGPVPAAYPQTAASAERLAIFFANRYMPGTAIAPYVGDCIGALRMLDDLVLARSPSSRWAQLAR